MNAALKAIGREKNLGSSLRLCGADLAVPRSEKKE